MRRTMLVFLPLAAVLALALFRANGPQPRPESTPASAFSAARAMTALRGVLVDRLPHPTGTDANRLVRSRLETRFRALGYETQLLRRFACNASANCATVENLLVTRPGNRSLRDAVLLVAHYDSVGAGGGASDDGLGVATQLEIARAIRGETFRNPVAFLVTDAEEAGLIGAEAFVASQERPRDIGVAINIEMRGTHGASNLFETSRGNRWLIRHLAPALPQPQASSLFATIYDLLPNDTDVSVFKRAGIASLNFAAIRGVNWYHTPLDDFAHASTRTLQHHGDNVLASVRVLGNADLQAKSDRDATYFDVLGFKLVWWPQEWTLWIGIVSLVLLLFAVRGLPPRTMTFGVLATFGAVTIAGAGGMLLTWIAGLRSEAIPFVARPLPLIVALCCWGMAAAYAAAAQVRKKRDAEPLLYGAAIVWHAIGITLALTLPGAAFLFVVPAVAITLCALARASETLTAAIGSTVAAIVLLPIIVVFYDALGSAMASVIALLVAFIATLFAPLFARRGLALLLAFAAVALTVVAAMQPAQTAFRPRAASLAWVDDGGAAGPRWVTPIVTRGLTSEAKFVKGDAARAPWSGRPVWSAPAPRLTLTRVAMSASRSGGNLRITVRSNRKANRVSLFVKGGRIVSVNGTKPPERPSRFRSRVPSAWAMAAVHGGQEMVVEVAAAGRVEAVASDLSFGLPASGTALARARDASAAVPIHDGDVTITRTSARY